ncbi:MAG: aminotransferase class III-fold pyridoxal phosphate-dependent enzyme, partial [Pseudomonadota bacterium]
FDMFKDDTDRLGYFRDISTFGGCTAGPAAAIENMNILIEEDLLGNSERMGNYLLERLHSLAEKYDVIGDVRGKGLFAGIELVTDRETKEPMGEPEVQAIVADCFQHNAVVIGATNRSLPGFNNTLLFSPALIATKNDIDEIINAVDEALGRAAA